MTRLLSVLLLLPLTLACGDKGATDTGGGDGSATICIDEDLGSDVAVPLAEATVDGDEYSGTCDGTEFGDKAPDWGWTWTAPTTNGYTFDTQGSRFDTVLVIRDGDCTGEIMACNDDISFDNTASSVYVELYEGQTITIIVDGVDVYQSGDVTLNVYADL